MPNPVLRVHAAALQRAALAAVDPRAAVRRHVRRDGSRLGIVDRWYDLDAFDRVFVVGGGKATAPLVSAVADILGDRLTAGVGVTKYGHIGGIDSRSSGVPPARNRVRIIEAGHPIPDENSVGGARAIIDMVDQATERDLVICLISGGGSALLTLPVPGLKLPEVQSMTNALLRSGATIQELNTVRKHWSQIKGGNLARAAAPAAVVRTPCTFNTSGASAAAGRAHSVESRRSAVAWMRMGFCLVDKESRPPL